MKAEELNISFFSDNELTIIYKWKTIELIKYSDGDVELIMTDGSDQMNHIFSKAQIDFLANWLVHC